MGGKSADGKGKEEEKKKEQKEEEEHEEYDPHLEDKAVPKALDEGDIAVMQRYGQGTYHIPLNQTQKDIDRVTKNINKICGVKESDTGLAAPALWDLQLDKRAMGQDPLQVARCTKIIDADTDEPKYVVNVKQIAKFVVGLGERVAPTDIEEGMRVGIDRQKLSIQIPLPPKIDPTVSIFFFFFLIFFLSFLFFSFLFFSFLFFSFLFFSFFFFFDLFFFFFFFFLTPHSPLFFSPRSP